MRARNIKPGFWKNEELAEIPYEARLLFIGLWGMADREGRLEDRPKRIRAEVFPFDLINIEKLLDVITLHGFIIRYEANAKRYIQIVNFEKHQYPHPHEARSIIPPCNDKPCNVHLNPDVMNPSSLNPDIMNTPSPDKVRPLSSFEALWNRYPKRIGRKAAEKHYKASVKTPEDVADIETALRRYLTSERVRGGFVQNGATWFNNWRDWVRDPEKTDRRDRAEIVQPKRLDPNPEPETEEARIERHGLTVKNLYRGNCKAGPECLDCMRWKESEENRAKLFEALKGAARPIAGAT